MLGKENGKKIEERWDRRECVIFPVIVQYTELFNGFMYAAFLIHFFEISHEPLPSYIYIYTYIYIYIQI